MDTPLSLKILLVEDNPGDALLFKKALEKSPFPYELTHCERLSQALEILRKAPVQIVLLDLSLPDSKGAATFKTTHRQFPGVPILVLTGNEDETMAFDALAEGVNNYIMKDRVSPGFLWEAIRNTLEKKRMIEQL